MRSVFARSTIGSEIEHQSKGQTFPPKVSLRAMRPKFELCLRCRVKRGFAYEVLSPIGTFEVGFVT